MKEPQGLGPAMSDKVKLKWRVAAKGGPLCEGVFQQARRFNSCRERLPKQACDAPSHHIFWIGAKKATEGVVTSQDAMIDTNNQGPHKRPLWLYKILKSLQGKVKLRTTRSVGFSGPDPGNAKAKKGQGENQRVH